MGSLRHSHRSDARQCTPARRGYRVTTPLRTILDIARSPRVSPEHLETAVAEALERGLVRRKRLRRARSAAGYTQEEAGLALGLDDTAIAKIERGKRGVGALELKRLASVYGVSVDELLDDPLAEGRVPLEISLRSVETLDPKVETMKRRM